ncbi:MAG: hypothetical protein KGJ93_00790 [Patescibacteria group bacterium]|nr:hypothetical protein [Patescibacteria group bacterium]
MRKQIIDEPVTRAKKREIKKRPRMGMYGRSLRAQSSHAGRKLAKQ